MPGWLSPMDVSPSAADRIGIDRAMRTDANELARQNMLVQLQNSQAQFSQQVPGNALLNGVPQAQVPGVPQAQNYGQTTAIDEWKQAQVKQFTDLYNPLLTVAQQTGNNDLKDQIGKIASSSTVPELRNAGEAIRNLKFTGKDEAEVAVDFTKEGTLDSFWKSNGPYFEQLGITRDSLRDAKGTITFKGTYGGKMIPTKWSDLKTNTKSPAIEYPFSTESDRSTLLASEYISDEVKVAIKAAALSPGGTITLGSRNDSGIYESSKFGGKLADNKSAVEFKFGSEPEKKVVLAQKLSPEVRAAIESATPVAGGIVHLQNKLGDTYTGQVFKGVGGSSLGRGMRGYIQSKHVPGAFFNRETGKTEVDIPDKAGNAKRVPIDTLTVQQQATFWKSRLAKAGLSGGQRAGVAYNAADLYRQEAQELKEIRDRIKTKNPGAWDGISSKLRYKNKFDQWRIMNTSDDPDLAEFIKGTTLLADVLQAAVGSAQGGEWAFELASKLLDTSLPDGAYDATVNKHERTLLKRAGIWTQMGEKGSTSFVEKPVLPGEVTEKKAEQVDNKALYAEAVKRIKAAKGSAKVEFTFNGNTYVAVKSANGDFKLLPAKKGN